MNRHIEIIEVHLQGASGDYESCEDVVVSEEEIVAVFDGATDKAAGQKSLPSPGRMAAEALARAAVEGARLPIHRAKEFVDYLSDAVASIDGPTESEPPSAVGALLLPGLRQVWSVGDVWRGIDGTFAHDVKELDRIAASARAAHLQCLLAAGEDLDQLRAKDPGRKLILPLLRRASVFRNRLGHPFSFGAFDGQPVPRELITVTDLPEGPCEVVLATDGYIDPAETLERSEEQLAIRLDSDPLRIDHPPGLKALALGNVGFDDRAYVRVRVPEKSDPVVT